MREGGDKEFRKRCGDIKEKQGETREHQNMDVRPEWVGRLSSVQVALPGPWGNGWRQTGQQSTLAHTHFLAPCGFSFRFCTSRLREKIVVVANHLRSRETKAALSLTLKVLCGFSPSLVTRKSPLVRSDLLKR